MIISVRGIHSRSPTEPEVYNAQTFIFAQQFLPLAFAVTDMLTDYIFT